MPEAIEKIPDGCTDDIKDQVIDIRLADVDEVLYELDGEGKPECQQQYFGKGQMVPGDDGQQESEGSQQKNIAENVAEPGPEGEMVMFKIVFKEHVNGFERDQIHIIIGFFPCIKQEKNIY